jgi:phenylacetate-CoA ligase
LLSTHHLGQATVEWFYRELVDFRPDVLFTTPGSAETLARLMHGRGFELDLPVLLTSSETLYPAGRGLLQARFGGQLLDYYGLAERVALASSVGDGPYFFNPAYGRVEFLPLGAEDAPPGARAYEIVATGYWNEAMPLVRFQTGDRAIVPADYSPRDMEDAALGLKPVSAIEGRDRVNVVSPRGDIIVGLPHMTKGVRGLLRLQVVQESRTELQFLALVDPQVGELDHAALLENASHWIPSDMNVVIREVDELQRLPSGKIPFVIRRL